MFYRGSRYSIISGSLHPCYLPSPKGYAKRTAVFASLRDGSSVHVSRATGCGGVHRHPEAGGRVFEALLACALLDNSILFAEPYVCRPWVVPLLLTGPLLAAPTVAPSFPYSTGSDATAHTLDPSTHFGGANNVAHPNTVFHDVFPDRPHSEHPTSGKSRGTWEDAIRVGRNSIRKGLIEGHNAKCVAQEGQMLGYHSSTETLI